MQCENITPKISNVVEIMKYLNLGCGNCYHQDWINIDLYSNDPQVITHDLSKGIPFPEGSCDIVYHSNIIEHFRCEDAQAFIKECFRVLKPGGILRVATPDLEQICRIYLETLTSLKNGDIYRDPDYEWILLEMYDQTVRESSGGQMLTYLSQNPIPNEEFVLERIGEEGRGILRSLRGLKKDNHIHLSQITPQSLFQWISLNLTKFRMRIFAHLLMGSQGSQAAKIGSFRLSGEVHQWMYDSYSLGKLIKSAGFMNPTEKTAFDSQMPEWSRFHLDTLPDGTVRKPDSFYMEAIKPKRILKTKPRRMD